MEKNIKEFNEKFIKNYDENSKKDHILKVDVEYLNLHNDLPFLPDRMKINKCSKLKWLQPTTTTHSNPGQEFLDIQVTIERGFILKRVRDMMGTYSVVKLFALFMINATILFT